LHLGSAAGDPPCRAARAWCCDRQARHAQSHQSQATNLKQCLATEASAFVAFYRAALDFRGSDQFALEISWPDGRKQVQRFRIDVGTSGGEGI
jgi:hypothetical protein